MKSSTGAAEAFAESSRYLDSKEYVWKLVSYVPSEVLKAGNHDFVDGLLLAGMVLLILLAIFSWLLAQAHVRLRQAEEEFMNAYIDLEKRVEERMTELTK